MTNLLPDLDTISTYGANNKVNRIDLPPANTSTDWDNPSLAGGLGNVAALGLVAPRIWVRFTLAASTGALVLLNWRAVWGNVTITPPILARAGGGNFTITLPTTVSDEYNASLGVVNNHTVNLLGGIGGLEGTTQGQVNVSATGNVITIRTQIAGTANDLAGSNVFVVAF